MKIQRFVTVLHVAMMSLVFGGIAGAADNQAERRAKEAEERARRAEQKGLGAIDPVASAIQEKKTAKKVKKSASSSLSDPFTGMKFVNVPGGCFQMGDTFGGGDSDEKPTHKVCVSDFKIGKYEVTQGQWKKIMGSNPSSFSSCGDDCPVENVSWNDVQEFIRTLNSQSGKQYRLPTEAEWEYAARSGGKREKNSGGDNIDTVAWYSSNSGSQTHPVGQKRPNGLGLYDMSGNVWEWVNDWKGDYSSGKQQNPQGPSSGTLRVNRGGSWSFEPRDVRAAARSGYAPGDQFNFLGFRLVSPVR